jgi:hypothetical protein
VGRPRADGQAVRVRRRRRHRPVPERHAGARTRGLSCGPRPLPSHRAAAVPDARGDQRRRARRRAGDRAPLRPQDDRALGAPRRDAGGLPRALPRVGRHAAVAPADRRGERGQGRREQPAAAEPDARRAEGVRARHRGRGARRCRVSRRLDRVSPLGAGRARRRRSLRRRGNRAPRAGRADGPSTRAIARRRTPSPRCCPSRRRRTRSTRSTSSSVGRRRASASPTRSRAGSRRSESSAPG